MKKFAKKKSGRCCVITEKDVPLHRNSGEMTQARDIEENEMSRAFSSAGSERLPYKQRVGGSNPSTPTRHTDGSLAQLNRAFDYGSKGCRFESCRSHHIGRG